MEEYVGDGILIDELLAKCGNDRTALFGFLLDFRQDFINIHKALRLRVEKAYCVSKVIC